MEMEIEMERADLARPNVIGNDFTEGATATTLAPEGLVILLASGAEDGGKRATLAFTAACSALAMDKDTQVFLSGDGSHWGFIGHTEDVQVAGFPPLEDLIQDFLELGGSLAMCSTCHEYCALPGSADEIKKQRRAEVNLSGFTAVISDLSNSSSITF